MKKVFIAEAVSKGHPDKVADQISDAILDAFLSRNTDSHVACETLVTENTVILSGEIMNPSDPNQSVAHVGLEAIARQAIVDAGYPAESPNFGSNAKITNLLHTQSSDLFQGLQNSDFNTAGDQGIVFGYACDRGPGFMPMEVVLARTILQNLASQKNTLPYLRSDAKCLVCLGIRVNGESFEYTVENIVLSCHHMHLDKEEMLRSLESEIFTNVVEPTVKALGINSSNIPFVFNPLGLFNSGGPAADTGLTGRKIVADSYGSSCPHGGGAFSGKDPSKVDRSGAYYARYIAKNVVAAGIASEAVVQISFVPGQNKFNRLQIDTRGTNRTNVPDDELPRTLGIESVIPGEFIERLQLKAPIYTETARYGHFGFDPFWVTKIFRGTPRQVLMYPWEQLDLVDAFKQLVVNEQSEK